jgi:NitT/TauT family transport system permease protein
MCSKRTTPFAVAKRLFELCATSDLYLTLITSFARIALGLLLGVTVGILGGILTASSKIARDFLSPLLAVIKSTPIASFIILILLWLDRNSVPVVISTLVVLPVVWANVESGILNTDKALLEMAGAYKMTRFSKIKHIYAPSTLPYFTAALNSSLSLAWKAGVAAEALVLPLLAIGTEIFEAKYNLETVDLFAWTVVVVILSVIIEKLAHLLTARIAKKEAAR